MAKIAIIDDIPSEGKNVARILDRRISPAWNAVYQEPLDDPSDYTTWITENDVWALVLDWKLCGTGRSLGQSGVTYTAKEVVKAVRSVARDFPIYVITTHWGEVEREPWFADVETFGSRSEFVDGIGVHAPRIVRAMARFRSSHRDALALISRLSAKSARSKISDEEKVELDAARASVRLDSLSIPLPMTDVLEEAESVRRVIDATLEKLRAKIEGDTE